MCLVIMKYLMLEGRFDVLYYYHFPLFNHFRNRDFISIPFFLLHSLEDMIGDVREKCSKGKKFTQTSDEASMNNFLGEGEELVHFRGASGERNYWNCGMTCF